MPVLWAARHNTWLLIQLTLKGVISFFLVMPVKPSSRGGTVLGIGVLRSLGLGCYSPWGWGVTVLGGQLAHLTTGRTWLFCFVWGGGRPQLKGGGV